jgi:hypothetical protein
MCCVLAIIVFAGVIRIPSLTQPLGPDQGIMSVIGEGILHGQLPYRDFWEMGSPAVFFTYALMFKIFGTSMAAIPITDTLVSMLTTFLIFLLAKQIWDRKVGYLSALVFAFFSNGIRLGMHAGGDIAFGTFWYIAQRETFMLPLIVASFYLLLRSQRQAWRPWSLFLSGVLAGLAFVYKFPAVVMLVCGLFYLNWNLTKEKGRNLGRRLFHKNLSLILGFVFALVPFALFFAVKGTLGELIDVTFRYVFGVYSQMDHNYMGTIKMAFVRTLFIAQENFLLWIFAITSGIFVWRHDRRNENVLVLLWGVSALLFVASHREFFGYHYLMVLPPFSLLTGYGLLKALGPRLNVRRVLTEDWGKAFVILTVVANLSFFAALDFMHYTKAYYYLTGKITQKEYYGFFSAYPAHDYSFPADYEAARYLSQHTRREDPVYVLGGTDSAIFFLAQRKPASRFIFSWFLFSSTHGRGPQAEAYRDELLTDLGSRAPKYIVTIHSLDTFREFPKIYNFVQEHYALEKVFPDDRYVYGLKPAAESRP